ncbi:two-component response regulator ORR9-like [Rhododendron vialii]|uniref:two-component response regulator ORR9-like n=1 Tax=Rhododendron vialii TaxID=182163 RepID=UPI00265ED3BE|nr:two-component response regulator ORR9-like [Rhododendron vialii]
MDLESRSTHGEYKKEELEKGEEQNFHVLAVDDSLTDRKLLERLLTVSSYQVTCVDSGNKALEYLGLLDNNSTDSTSFTSSSSSSSCTSSSSQSPQQQGSKVNLIITDYSMPGMNGYDLLKKVKGSSWKDIPVVVMSSENVPSRINMCLEGGAEEFLLKPVQLSDLSKIHSHLSKPLVRSSQNRNLSAIDNIHDSDSNTNTNTNERRNCNGNKRKLITQECSERRPKMKEVGFVQVMSSTFIFGFLICFVAIFMCGHGFPFFAIN